MDEAGTTSRRDVLRAKGGLRRHAARGTLVNASFNVGLQVLGLVRGFVVAAIIAPGDYGLWGIITVSYATILRLKDVGVADKFVQQDDEDQEQAFQRAFTLELILSGAFWFVLMACAPALAVVYGEPKLLMPALIAACATPAIAFQMPLWIFYRDMDFFKQRTLQLAEPLVNTSLTVGLALAGFGYWSFVVGSVCGIWAAAIVLALASPFRFALRYDRDTMRQYRSFSVPLFLQAFCGLLVAQGTVLVTGNLTGLAGVGALSLAATITTYTQAADGVVTQTLYPAVCAVRDRVDLMYESFVKSNRLALMWGIPFGVAVALFAQDLVDFGIGEEWAPAVIVFQAAGLVSAIGHIGFNWDAYFRATSNTRPMAIWSFALLIAYAVGPIPGLLLDGLRGYAIGLGVVAVVSFIVRWYFLRQMFHGFAIGRHTLRAVTPTVPAVVAVLLVRALEQGDRSLGAAIAEGVLYVVVTAVATVLLERSLLAEAFGYLRRAAPQRAPASA